MRRSLVVAAALILGGAFASLDSLGGPSRVDPSPAARAQTGRLAHESLRERDREQEGEGEGEDQGYADRAYPAAEVAIANVEGAIAADAKLKGKSASRTSRWESLGPDTLDVDRLGTQSFIKPTQWSGRLTAVTAGLRCDTDQCPLYVGAAGGGVWQTKDALNATPHWKQISQDIPTNAIGSIAVDPNDP